ncbi:hypothetical protein GCM10010402_50560 [Actinomadura luteofluorescens]
MASAAALPRAAPVRQADPYPTKRASAVALVNDSWTSTDPGRRSAADACPNDATAATTPTAAVMQAPRCLMPFLPTEVRSDLPSAFI